MKSNSQNGKRAGLRGAVTLLCLISVLPVKGGDPAVELREAMLAIEALQRKNAELQESILAADNKIKVLGEGLAAANAESAQFRESYRTMRLQLEALGISAIEDDENRVEQRLLSAVNDRRLLKEENSKLIEEIFNLSEAFLQFVHSAVGADPEAKEMAEAALNRAEETLRLGIAKPDPEAVRGTPSGVELQNARIISLKAEFGLVVFDVGEVQGAREGMRFRVMRGERLIGTVLLVDVRDKICGAIVQHLASEEPFAVGDIGRVTTDIQH